MPVLFLIIIQRIANKTNVILVQQHTIEKHIKLPITNLESGNLKSPYCIRPGRLTIPIFVSIFPSPLTCHFSDGHSAILHLDRLSVRFP